MTSRTSGGLLKFSVAIAPDLVTRLDELAERREVSRNNAINYLLRRSLDLEAQDQDFERRKRTGAAGPAEVLCHGLSDADLEAELKRRRRVARATAESIA